MRKDPERLKKYAELIAGTAGGMEALKTTAERIAPALEERAALAGFEAVAASPENVAELAQKGFENLERGREPSLAEYSGMEAIINAEIRPAIDIIGGTFTVAHPLWTQLSADAQIRQRIEAVIPFVGRIELPGNTRLPYGGTGFVVGPNLIMTNRHVAQIFATGWGDRKLTFMSGASAGIDFEHERNRPPGHILAVRSIAMIHPYWDMALLQVEGLPPQQNLKLSLADARDLVGRNIFVIGYPAFDPRNPAGEQQDLFDSTYGVKRLQPGLLQGGMQTASFGKLVKAATHDCSTLGGNSGSAVCDLGTGEVLALHFGGRYHEQNFAVPSHELARDDRVLKAGVQFAGSPQGSLNEWGNWWQRADQGDERPSENAATTSGQSVSSGDSQTTAAQSPPSPVHDAEVFLCSKKIEIPLRITISLGEPCVGGRTAPAVVAEAAVASPLEAMAEPQHDTDYRTRRGYKPDFLVEDERESSHASAWLVPAPTAKEPLNLAKTRSGADILHYQNFSIAMHASRRLALFTASNVTKEPELKKPDPAGNYTRAGLSGLGKGDQERWFFDPRLDAKLQLPDVFFTKDRGAFDKGHIVRRDDVAWGKTYEQLKRANGDSYHVTNCSPQVAGFNRSAQGDANWGDLENHVLSEAANERLCVFAGPVLDPQDEVFVGKGDGGLPLRAKIPSRFWKVIVARVEDGIAAYGFVLEQDLSEVEYEFAVTAEFAPAMYPITEIAEMTGVEFAPVVAEADQYDTVRGGEVARRASAPRKRRKR